MRLERLLILLGLGVLYFVGGHILARRAMKHFRGPEQSIWLETPLVDQTLFTEEGRRIIRILRLYYVVAGAALVGVGAVLNRLD